jgi:hypothetical protein
MEVMAPYISSNGSHKDQKMVAECPPMINLIVAEPAGGQVDHW